MIRRRPPQSFERGMVLISSLLMLVVVTILAVGLFRSFGIDERIAGNVREKQRSLQAAESAQQYAEWWLSNGNATTGITCSTLVASSVGQICANTLPIVVTNVAAVPWQISGVNVGVTYTPPNMTVNTTSSTGTYYASPVFYISYLGLAPTGLGSVYQIDAVGYGGGPSTAAVVESTYLIQSSSKDLGAQ
jgi:type IV pilus assembly protein PilX